MTNLGWQKSVYDFTLVNRITPVFESRYNQLWLFSHLLYSKLALKRKWIKPPPPENDDGTPSQSEACHGGFISDLAFSSDGRYLVAGSTSCDVYVFDPNTTRPEIIIHRANPDAITRVCFTGNTKFVSGSANGSLMLWDVRRTSEAVCSLVGHTKVIRSTDYDSEEDILVTSASDDQIRYWKVAECQLLRQDGSGDEGVANQPCDVLLSCLNVSLACMSLSCKKLAFITTSGSLFIVDNLDINRLKADMHRFRFDNSILLQLSWFNPNSALNSRNRLRVIESDDIVPASLAKITKVNYMGFHNTLPLLVARVTTSRQLMFGQEKKEWTCGYNLQEMSDTAALYYSHKCMSSFGSDVIQEKLTYSTEEERYNPLREKRLSFSGCGRLIASPGKRGIRLLSYSNALNMPFDMKAGGRKQSPFLSSDSLWSSSTTDFNVFSNIEMPENSSVCTKFSPHDYMLAVGDINNQVYFFQPVL